MTATEVLVLLDVIRLITGMAILFYASYTDLKIRRASNILWLIMGSIGGILLVIQYFIVGFENLYYLLFIPLWIGVVYLFFQMRLIFGGADAKALMALAILVPLQPSISQLPILSQSFFPGSWVILVNSLFVFLFIPLSLMIFNITKRNIRFPHVFIGYKMSIKKAREKFVWPLEKLVDGKRKFAYMPKDFDADDEYDDFEKHGINEIWVTPKIPFMIPILIGFICTFILGDILFYLMSLF